MDINKLLWNETGRIAFGQLICSGVIAAVFALVGRFDMSVILGAAVGAAIATLNYFVMAFCIGIASCKAGQQDVKGGQTLLQMSYTGRLAGLFVVLAICAKSGVFHLLALVLPLAFTRPILTVSELFKKKGGNQA